MVLQWSRPVFSSLAGSPIELARGIPYQLVPVCTQAKSVSEPRTSPRVGKAPHVGKVNHNSRGSTVMRTFTEHFRPIKN
jgi:hypothetical protein